MKEKKQELTIFAALPVLEAAVRHNSFTKAAREFGLSQSALSRRIQGLEQDLGVVLFARQGRSITLTEEGRRMADAARASINLIAAARQTEERGLQGTLRVGVLPSLASCWLAPRLHRFCAHHPDLKLRVETIHADFRDAHKDPVTWDPSEFDLVITRGHGGWRSLHATKLTSERMIAVHAPDMIGTQRLGHSTRTGAWSAYLTENDLKLDMTQPALVFEHYHMIVEAARVGAGVGLVPEMLVSNDLEQGRLIRYGKPVASGASYYALTVARSADHPSVSGFVEWIKCEAGR